MSPDNDIAPLSRPPRDLLEMWQEIHRDDWKALLRPKPFEMDYTPPSPQSGDEKRGNSNAAQ